MMTKTILGIIFIVSAYFVFEFGSGISNTENRYTRPGYTGGAIGFGIIAGASVLGFVYYACNYKK